MISVYYLQDAHNAILEFDTNSSLFAVYDGHGGHEVAVYTAKHLPNFIKKNSLYLKGQMDEVRQYTHVVWFRRVTYLIGSSSDPYGPGPYT